MIVSRRVCRRFKMVEGMSFEQETKIYDAISFHSRENLVVFAITIENDQTSKMVTEYSVKTK